jgi:hypothetical protein
VRSAGNGNWADTNLEGSSYLIKTTNFERIESMDHDAVISKDGLYRYWLSRTIAPMGKKVTFIGLNPSTADAIHNDPTISRCISFAKQWGASTLIVVNLFAYRSTDPRALKVASDPVGPENDTWLKKAVTQSDLVVAAWGNGGNLNGRAELVKSMFPKQLHALRLTKQGMPGHPLYLPSGLRPTPLR